MVESNELDANLEKLRVWYVMRHGVSGRSRPLRVGEPLHADWGDGYAAQQCDCGGSVG